LSQTSLNILVTATTAQAQAQLAAVNAQMKAMAAQAGISAGTMNKIGKGAAAGAAGVAAVGAAAAIAGKQLYDLGAEFDKAYDTIRVGTGATGKELKKLKASFKDVAKTVPNDFKEVGTAIADLNTRMGLAGKPLEEMAESMLHLSNITGTDLQGNIKAVARAFVDWEVPINRQTNALDGLFRLSQESGASVSEIADSIQKFGSPLRTLGLDIDYAASMFANFERAGVNTQTMVPGLKFAIANISDPTEELGKTLKALGVSADDPAAGLQKLFAAIGADSTLTKVEKINLAMDVFGRRAGADMAEAVRQGRFDVERFMRIFRDQKNGDSIRKASKDAYDFSENMKIFGNKIKVAIEPAATAVFAFATRISKWLAGPNGSKAIKVLGQIFTATFRAISAAIRPFVTLFRVSFNAIKGFIKAAGNTWEAVSDQFKSRVETVKSAVKGLVAPFRNVFSTIADVVKDKFSDAYSAAAGFVNAIIGVLNKIPGVDIGEVNTGTTSRLGAGSRRTASERAQGLQRGGVLQGGTPTGDSIPALLERGEYVLNREAVKKVGVERLNQLNFRQAARFQTGGPIGMIGGGVVDTITDVVGGAANAVGDVASAVLKPAKFFLNLLPDPNLPQPVTGTGPWAIGKATDFIKDKVSDLFAQSSSVGGTYTGPPPNFAQLGNNEWVDSNTMRVASYLASKFGLSISSSYRSPEHNAAVGGVPGSSHTRGTPSNPGAFDFVPASGALMSFAGKHVAGITENMMHDVGSGLHNHIAFFQKGGLVGGRATRGGGTATRSGGSMEPWKVARVARAAGWRGNDLQTAIAVAGAESRFDPRANYVTSAEDSRGLWQINTYAHGGGSELYNPMTNARVAYNLWKDQGWGPWAGYTSGNYQGFLGQADHAIETLLRIRGGKGGAAADPEPKLTAKQKKARRRVARGARRALGYAEQVQDEAKNKKLSERAVNAATKAVSLAKDGEYGKAHKWTKKAKALSAKAAKSIPGLKPKRPPFATSEFDKGDKFSPTNLPGFKALPGPVKKLLMSPGLSWQGRRDLADMALTLAGQTDTKKDDAAALNLTLGLERGRRAKAQKQLRKANAVLARGGLTKKQRRKWQNIRNTALDTSITANQEIVSTKDTIRDLNESDTSEAETTMAEAMKELAAAIKEQNRLQSGVQAVGSREALRMLSDVISGEIVGKRAAPGPSYAGVRY
jgi:TP901 family phage tail tape measure protein